MRTCLFTVVYPAVQKYLSEFLASLDAQTDQAFDLVIADNAMPQLEALLGAWRDRSYIVVAQGTPVAARQRGLQFVLEAGYDAVVLADADDCAAPNRMAVVRRLLRSNPIVFNELLLFNDEEKHSRPWLGNHFREGQSVDAADLEEANCLGFSNTALRTNLIEPRFLTDIPEDQIAFDWAFFARIVAEKPIVGTYTGETFTKYRQHGGNIASPSRLDDEAVMRGVRVKSQQYAYLGAYNSRFGARGAIYSGLAARLTCDLDFRERYCSAVRRAGSGKNLLWWEAIRLFPEGE